MERLEARSWAQETPSPSASGASSRSVHASSIAGKVYPQARDALQEEGRHHQEQEQGMEEVVSLPAAGAYNVDHVT